jgi:hypothetical protein
MQFENNPYMDDMKWQINPKWKICGNTDIIYNKYIYKVRDLKHQYRYNPVADHQSIHKRARDRALDLWVT